MTEKPFMVDVARELVETNHLDVAEYGAFLRLRAWCWRTGQPLPESETERAAIVGESLEEWQFVKPKVLMLFVRCEDGLRHPEVERQSGRAAA